MHTHRIDTADWLPYEWAMQDFRAIICMWPRPSIRSFADDIGVPYGTAQIWKHRNSIPPEYWDLVVAAAERRGLDGISLEHLQRLAAAKRRPLLGNGISGAAA